MSKFCIRGQDAAATAIRKQADTIAAMAPAVRALEVEAIHAMRVASRRLRMAIQIYRPFLPKSPRKLLGKQARRITGLLGIRRELDVMAAMLREHREETRDLWLRFMDHAIEIVDARRDSQMEFCVAAADLAESGEFQEQVESLLAGIDGNGLCSRKLAKKELSGAHEAARKARKRWKKTADPGDLHQVRIELKHLRYVCEFHTDVYGEPIGEAIQSLKDLQAVLGEWNECRLLEDMVLTIGNAADYTLAQGAPLVAEAYGNRAAELAAQFGPMGKTILEGDGRKAFLKLAGTPAVKCCPKKG